MVESGGEKVLQCINLQQEFKTQKNVQRVLQGIDFHIHKNDFITIMGTSGSGKSTFLHCLSLLIEPTKGKIIIHGEQVNFQSDKRIEALRQASFGMVFQNIHLISCLSTLENLILAIHKKIGYKKKVQIAMGLLHTVGMETKANALVTTLSGGEQQRVAILRAVINHPPLLLCDEPTGALDAKTSEDIIDFLIQICKEHNSALLIVTHDPQIGKLGKRQYMMKDGMLHEI